MKTSKMNLSNVLLKGIILFLLFGITSCGDSQVKSGNENSKKVTAKAKAPNVDIHSAAFMGNIVAINQHISAGTDLNAKDQYGSTPLNIAITFGRNEVAKALINGGASLNTKNNDGSTPLHIAAFFCRTEIVKALLAKDVDKNVKNSFGSTPLETVSGSFESVKPVYTQINKDLGPLGLKLDYSYLESTRPKIAELLK